MRCKAEGVLTRQHHAGNVALARLCPSGGRGSPTGFHFTRVKSSEFALFHGLAHPWCSGLAVQRGLHDSLGMRVGFYELICIPCI